MTPAPSHYRVYGADGRKVFGRAGPGELDDWKSRITRKVADAELEPETFTIDALDGDGAFIERSTWSAAGGGTTAGSRGGKRAQAA